MPEINGEMKALIVVLLLATWLPGGLACFCCDTSHPDDVEQSVGTCSDFPASAPSGNGSEKCGFCCGHQVFTLGFSGATVAMVLPEEISICPNLIPIDQLQLRSIYHPPKA
jgi:hypothetical protein